MTGKVLNVKDSIRVAVAVTMLILSPFVATPAKASMDVDREFEFASGLIELGFSDLANRVVDAVLRLHPDQRDRATRIQGEILIAQRRFAEAEELAKTMPDDHPQRHALQLRIAQGYFRIGETDQARAIYDAFFERYKDRTPTDPDLLRFYQDAAYQYGQMLERMRDREGAAQAYRRLLNAGLDDPNAERRLQMDLARLFLQLGREKSGEERENYLKQSFELCEEIQWGGYDLWFGQSISVMAHVEMVRGNDAGARELLQRYMSDLNKIDDLLRKQNFPSAMSPVAGARFLLGELYEKQVRELRGQNAPEREILGAIQRALTEYYNVFGKYGTSEWGAEAGMRGRELVNMLENEYGRSVNIDFGEHMTGAAQAQYTHADDLFRQRDYKQAIEEYLRILNAFPEGDPSIRALANLLLSYAHLEDELHVLMMSSYLSERFPNNNVAANALLIAGRMYVEQENEEMYNAIFGDYFDGFPNHERAPALLFDMARRSEAAGEREAAAHYYQRIVENYPRDRFFLRALFAMAHSAYQSKDFEEAESLFRRYVEASRPGHDRIRGQFLLADTQQKQQKYAEAIQSYGQIVRWLSVDNPPDNARPEDAERNAGLLERSLFFVGYCYGRIREPEEQVETYRQRGIAAYDHFLRRHPESSLAPPAMRDKGAIQLALGQSSEAAATFEQLAREYPDSEEGRSALFALVSSAFEIGETEIARDAFRRMIATPDAYSPEEFTRIGQLMLDNGLYEDVIPAYRRVLETTEQRQMLELALHGLGYAYNHQGNHAEAVSALNDLLERFPNTSFFYEARFLLADSHRELEQYNPALTALNDILRLSQDNIVNQRAQFKLGEIQRLQGNRQEALATFQRIALLQDPENRRLRPIIERSLVESLDLMMELELYQDVEDVSIQFLSDFPGSDHVEDVRRIRADARRRAIQ